ncbi:UNVERIFIED_CONTAM: hypothetical protein K2H54_011602 [Gekko kuhli]
MKLFSCVGKGGGRLYASVASQTALPTALAVAELRVQPKEKGFRIHARVAPPPPRHNFRFLMTLVLPDSASLGAQKTYKEPSIVLNA